jgi:hypothetical protein
LLQLPRSLLGWLTVPRPAKTGRIVAEQDPKERIQISLAQVAASSAAAVSAAVVCSFFGVAGTIIGTAITSMVATVGSALYAHSLRRTKSRLRKLHQAGAASPPLSEVLKTSQLQGRRWLSQLPWRGIGLGTAVVFVFSIGLVTVVEISAGKPLSALFGVSHSGNRGTTLGSVVGVGGHRSPKAKPSPSPSSTPSSSPSPSPTVTRTAPTSPPPTATATSSPTGSPTPSGILSSILKPG